MYASNQASMVILRIKCCYLNFRIVITVSFVTLNFVVKVLYVRLLTWKKKKNDKTQFIVK